ncbi:MAG: flagellar hook-basal body protein [Candidatus Baltobacteraceae bacterium]
MNRALYAAASGMAAQQQNLELIAQNLSNADVSGFKGIQASFAGIAADAQTLGVAPLGTHAVFSQGKLMRGTGEFDLALDGPGFFCVTDASGNLAYTRNGEFARAADGTLRSAQGWHLRGVRIPAGAGTVSVAPDGSIFSRTGALQRSLGKISVVTFAAPESLRASGGTLFFATAESGKPRHAALGADRGTSIKFGMLEQSNVTIVEAMMQIMAAQRAYEANAKGVQAADEMLRIANNLNRA